MTGRIAQIKDAGGTPVLTIRTQYQYDTWNRLLNITYPDPKHEVVTYSYDSGGLVNGVSSNSTYDLKPNYVPRIDYDKFGHRLLIQICDSTTGNNTQTIYAYDPATQRLTNLQATLLNCYTFHNMNFTYDNVGNVTQIQNAVTAPHSSGCGLGNVIGGPWTKTYAYDDLCRLISSNGSFGTTQSYSFGQSYDSIHNITQKTQQALASSSVQPQISHIAGTPITVPLPATRHLDAHMPGGFRFNPGGPGSAVPPE